MRKLLFSCLVLISFSAFSQEGTPPQPTFYVTLQMATDTVKKGIDTVRLTEDAISEMNESVADTNFDVVLTPIGDCGQLNLIKTNSRYFIIKELGNSTTKSIFNYVVMVRQNRPWRPQMSRMPPRPPGESAPPQH